MSRKVELVRLMPDASQDEAGGTDACARGAADVFPTEHKKLKRVDEDVIASVVGGKKSSFLSEAQLEENKLVHGERLEDGTFSGRTLREAIAANKEEKEAKFQNAWKQMKTGKNRPLDDGEADFFDHLEHQEQEKLKAIRASEAEALAMLEEARRQAALEESSQPSLRAVRSGVQRPRTLAKRRPQVRPVMRHRDADSNAPVGAAQVTQVGNNTVSVSEDVTSEVSVALEHGAADMGNMESAQQEANTDARGEREPAKPMQALLSGYGASSSSADEVG